MADFTFLQISDLHLSTAPNRKNLLGYNSPPSYKSAGLNTKYNWHALPSSYDVDLAEAVARYAYQHKSLYQGIIISGDLATTGTDLDLQAAHDFINLPAELWTSAKGTPTIGGLGKRLIIIPGNHDRYCDGSGDAGCGNFDKKFRKYWIEPNSYVDKPITDRTYVNKTIARRRGKSLAFMQVDFSLQQNADCDAPVFINKWGQGRVYGSVLDRLIIETTDLQKIELKNNKIETPVVWVSHFPPTSYCNRTLKLIDHRNLIEAAKSCGIKYIISGHLHSRNIYMDSDVTVLGAGTACGVDTEDRHHWIHYLDFDITQAGDLICYRKDFHWDHNRGNFI